MRHLRRVDGDIIWPLMIWRSSSIWRALRLRSTSPFVSGHRPRSSSFRFTGSYSDVAFGPDSSGRRGSAVRPGFSGRTFTVTSRRMANPWEAIDIILTMRQLISGRHFGAGQFRSKGIGSSIRLRRSDVHGHFQTHGEPFDHD